jgi:hypothetical protein
MSALGSDGYNTQEYKIIYNKKGFLDYLIPILLGSLGILTVVLPNSFKTISTSIVLFTSIFCILRSGYLIIRSKILIYACAMIIITLIYIGVGSINGAPMEAVRQVLLIYLLFPLMWIAIAVDVVETYSAETIVSWFIILLILSAISIAYYFWAFQALGAYAVKFLVEDPNVDIRAEGYVAAIMYVYGSLIFMAGGLLGSPSVIKSAALRVAVLLIAIAAALTSGRSALILAVALGVLVSLGYSLVGRTGKFNVANLVKALLLLVSAVGLIVIVIGIFREFFAIDLTLSIDLLFDKLTSRGGAGRSDQSYALLDAIAANWGLGSGHGVNVIYVVDPIYPWRYEMIWLASIFRVGVFGAAIYALPFIVTLIKTSGYLLKGKLSAAERYLFAGFICAFAASNTNPYIEGIVFQWMYILPLAYFLRAPPQQARMR